MMNCVAASIATSKAKSQLLATPVHCIVTPPQLALPPLKSPELNACVTPVIHNVQADSSENLTHTLHRGQQHTAATLHSGWRAALRIAHDLHMHHIVTTCAE